MLICSRPPGRVRWYSWYSTPHPRPIVVAMAAPATPICGNGPSPKMRHGPSTMLMVLANHSTRIAMAASPAPRKMALMRNSSITVPQPPSITRENVDPVARTLVAGAHRRDELRTEEGADQSQDDGHAQSENDGLHGGDGRALGILLADAPGHRGRGANRDADRHRVDGRHQRLGEADRSHRVRAEAPDEEDVHDREHRLHHHLEHHRHGEQDHRAPDRRLV